MKNIKQPSPRDSETINRIFSDTGLSWGAAYVFRHKNTLYAIADNKHCPTTSRGNISALRHMLEKENLCYAGKDYDADIYKATGRVTDKDFEEIQFQLGSWGEPLEIIA